MSSPLCFVMAFCGVLLLGRVQAGVIRDEGKVADVTFTTPPTVEEAVVTTVETPRDGADVTVDVVDGGLLVATSRDRDESVKLVAIASVDPVPTSAEDELDEEVVLLNPNGPAPLTRSGRLLLLSTPKLMERPKEQEEENIEEPEEIVDVETTTVALVEAETTAMPRDESAESSEEQKDGKLRPSVTKLYPINIDAGAKTKGELREAQAKKEGEEVKKEDTETKKDDGEVKKEDAESKKDDTEAKKEDSEAKKEDPEAKKDDSEAKKEDPEAKKDDAEAKKEDTEAQKTDSEPKKDDSEAMKDVSDAKKDVAEAKQNTSSAESDEKDTSEQQEESQQSSGSRTPFEVASLIDDAPAITAEQPNAPLNDNSGTAVLIETEADYVLVESDAEELGSFTHADSDLHLQPIVQSVEIVPTHVDDPLIVSYVHQW